MKREIIFKLGRIAYKQGAARQCRLRPKDKSDFKNVQLHWLDGYDGWIDGYDEYVWREDVDTGKINIKKCQALWKKFR